MDKKFWQDRIINLPTKPGVYLFKDEHGEVIYVGKAKSLRNRVASYFRDSKNMAPKVLAMRERARDIDVIVVDSPAEALLLECNYIKEYRPHYNIMLKDDKHYPYIKLTTYEEYPRLMVVRSMKHDGAEYFGPYTNVGAMNDIIKLIRRVFPLRGCGATMGRMKDRACLNYHIEQCKAPCMGYISKEDYRKIVDGVSKFLHGDMSAIKAELTSAMMSASDNMDYERAANYRDSIKAMSQIVEEQKMMLDNFDDRDYFSVYRKNDDAVIMCFFLRNGKIIGKEHFVLNNCEQIFSGEILQFFLSGFYEGDRKIPKDIILSHNIDDEEILADILKVKRGKKVTITVPQKGDKKRLINLALKNAELIYEENRRIAYRESYEHIFALEELRRELNLEVTPSRIECYDISNTQGTNSVGSMVVFTDGKPDNREYRKFKIKTVEGSNDFASLHEVLKRRFTRGLEERAKGNYDGFGHFPDLLIIDGGKGQLKYGLMVRDELNLDIPFISLAKEEELLILPNCEEPLRLEKNGAAYQLIQRIRDEAHRFAITFHRSLRSKSQIKSVLDDIPLVGEKRKKSLLKHFGSVNNIKRASVEELALVDTMNLSAAESVYLFLHTKNKIEDK